MLKKTPSSPSPQKAKVCRSQKKHMFIFFYDVEGVVLTHAVLLGQTINSAYYKKVKNLYNFHFIIIKYYIFQLT